VVDTESDYLEGEYMIKAWSGRLLAACAFLLVAFAPALADDPPGILWEMKSQMSMPGLPITPPPNTVNVCTAREWTQPPPGRDTTCVNSNFQRSGSKVTWDMQCGGEMPMTGHGEINFEGEDSYSGAIAATADGMSVTINLSGEKLGTCDHPIG
jgi:hypothetical protein